MLKPLRNLLILSAAAMLLSACGSSGPRITYTGHQESTEGVPGFVNGKKISPNVKLGQSYYVDDDLYVPRFEPDYVEEGMASWYGPGFHGGATANGESFDKHSMTAAHRTLPLPSIVKVTLLSSGKSAYVRINDRGPYARGRIIDLSYGAANAIGMIGKGTGKVRVEYMLAESQRFADLLAQGRSPDSIDVASEVLPYAKANRTHYAAATKPAAPAPAKSKPGEKSPLWDHLNPVATAHAEEPIPVAPEDSDDVTANELAAPVTPVASSISTAPPTVSAVQPRGDPPPIAPIARAPVLPARATIAAQSPPISAGMASNSAAPEGGVYLQLGTFSQRSNALNLQQKVTKIGQTFVMVKQSGTSQWYRVRMGPYTVAEATKIQQQLQQAGISGAAQVRQ